MKSDSSLGPDAELQDLDELDDLPWEQLRGGTPGCTRGPCSSVSAKIRTECTKDLCPSSHLGTRSRLLLSVGFSMGVMGLLVLLFGRNAEPPAALRVALYGAAGWGVVMLCVLVVGFVKPPGRRASVRLRTVIAFGLPVAFFAYLLLTGQSGPGLPEFAGEHVGRAAECGVFALGTGGLSSAGVLFAWRKTDPLTPSLSGSLAGLVGGLGAALAVGAVCPTTDAWHLVFSHGIVVVACTVAGAVLGRRLLAP